MTKEKKMIRSRGNLEIPKIEFENYLKNKINKFPQDKKQIYFGRTLSFLSLAPFNKDIPFDFSDTEELLDLKSIIYAQKANSLAVTNWMASLGAQSILGAYAPIDKISEGFEIKDIHNKYALFKHVFDKKFFGTKTEPYFDLNSEKNKKFYHLITQAKTVKEGIKLIQAHHKGLNTLDKCLVDRLKNEEVNLTLYRPNPLPKRKEDTYFLIIKEKTPLSIAEKLAANLAKQNISSKNVPGFELGTVSIKDFYGFSFNTQEFIDINGAYERSTINKIKQLYSNNENIFHYYASEKDNFYRNEDREMKGIQMYLAPNESALTRKGGLKLPFPDVAGRPEDLSNLFLVSFHLQDAKAFAEAQIGGYGVMPHMQYKDSSRQKTNEQIRKMPSKIKRTYPNNVSLIESVNDMYNLYVAYAVDSDQK